MKFKAVNWTPNELIGESKTDQMTDNAEWLFINTPRAIYTLGGLRRTEGVKIAAGRVIIAKRMKSDSASATVKFGNFFTARCEPIITTGIVSEHQTKIFATIHGDGGRLQPDNSGFRVAVNIAAEAKRKDKIARSFYITWQAMGY